MGAKGKCLFVSQILWPLSVCVERLGATQSEQERAELNPQALLKNTAVLWFLLKIIASILPLQTEIKIPNPQQLSHISLDSKEEEFSLILSPPKRRTARKE